MADKIANFVVIGGILTVIILKIVGVITIPWLWLLSPLWLLFGFGFIIAVILILLMFIEQKIDQKEKNK